MKKLPKIKSSLAGNLEDRSFVHVISEHRQELNWLEGKDVKL